MSRSIVQSLALSVVIAWGAITTRNVAAVVIEWNTNANGSFGDLSNWDPMQVPGLGDVVRFDRGDQSYTVSFGGIFGGINRTSFVLVVADDAVTFDLQGATYELDGVLGQPSAVTIGESAGLSSLFTDTASLSVEDGTLIADIISLGAAAQINHNHVFRASGTLNIDGLAGSPVVRIGNDIRVGAAGRGTLNISGGGELTGELGQRHDGVIGDNATSIGTANVEGQNSEWDNLELLVVGNQGDGNLNVTNGGRIFAETVFLAQQTGSTADVLVDGLASGFFHSQLNATQELYVGGSDTAVGGAAIVTIQNDGFVTSATTKIWNTGAVTLNGGRFSVTTLEIVPGGTFDWQAGRFRIQNMTVGLSGVLGDMLTIGAARELEVVNLLTVATSSTLTLDGGLIITDSLDIDGTFAWNSGTLHVTGDLQIDSGGPLGDNYTVSGTKTLIVRKLSAGQQRTLSVGENGSASLQVGNGATVLDDFAVIGGGATGNGIVTVSNSALWITGDTLTVGDAGIGQLDVSNATVEAEHAQIGKQLASQGTVAVNSGMMRVVTDAAGQTTMSIGGAGNGTLNIEANALVELTFHHAIIGESAAGDGTVNVTGSNAAWVLLGAANTVTVGDEGTGRLNITQGGAVGSGKGFVGKAAGSHGMVQVDGQDAMANPSSWQPLFLDVGGNGLGELHITGGGFVQTQEVFVGLGMTGDGRITVDGPDSHLLVQAPADANIVLGVDGLALLEVTAAGSVTAKGVFVGDGPDSTAVATVIGPGSNLDAEELIVAFAGTGTFQASNNGSVQSEAGFLGALAGSGGTATFDSGGAWTIANDLYVGGNDAMAGGTGELNLNTGGAVGVADTATIWPTGTINLGGGTLTAGVVNHINGGTFNFTDGTLIVDTFQGDLSQQGGTLAPGASPGVTTVTNDYTLNAGTLTIELAGKGGVAGTDFDQLIINDNATINGGTFDVDLLGGFMPTLGVQFQIFSFGGTVSGVGFSAFDLPALATGLEWQTGNLLSSGILEVVAALPGDFDFDGDVDGADFLLWQRGGSPNLLSALDLADWEANYGAVAPLSATSVAVPEPATAVMLMLGMAALLFRRDVVVP